MKKPTCPSRKRNHSLFFNLLSAILLLTSFSFHSCKDQSSKFPIHISVDIDQVEMGRTIQIEAVLKDFNPGERMILLPFVNGKRWGSNEFADKNGTASFIIPLPNPGPALIQVIAVPAQTDTWLGLDPFDRLLKTGTYMPESEHKSNTCLVEVKDRDVPRKRSGETLFGVQWESWFLPESSWETSQGVPIMGIYDNTDLDVYRQQILWFMDMGVDFIIPDWSNHIWGKKHWTERSASADGILHTTQLFLEVLADMRDEGLDVPKVALMPGLTNGPPTTMEALNEQLEWIYQDYVRNPRFKDLWQIYEGKPLIIILDTGILAEKKGTTESAFRIPFFEWSLTSLGLFDEASIDALRQQQGQVDDTHFTVRWMSSQNQTTRHHEFGYWSWMDGSLAPMVTYKDGKAESVVVTPSFFAEYGWTAPEAYGRRGGWTYLESFKTALEHRPAVIMLHQWNEYRGQAIGHGHGPNKDVFLDTYSVEFSDDLEPISPTAPGYRGVEPYGFYYLNLTRALMDIYRGDAKDVTLLAVNVADSTGNDLKLEWTTIGVAPESFTLNLDGEVILDRTQELAHSIPMNELASGEHVISVVANGVGTRYALSKYQYDLISDKLMPVVVERSVLVK
jgi:hypothetical protein